MTTTSSSRLTLAYGGVAITYPFVFAILFLIVSPSSFFDPIAGGEWELMFYSLILSWIQGGIVALVWVLVNGLLLEFIRSRLNIKVFIFVLIGGVFTAVTTAAVYRLLLWSPVLRNAEFMWGIFTAQGFLSGAIGAYCLHMSPNFWTRNASA